jgi:hypothetical protein
MCSTPRPKTTVKAKVASSGAILSAMNSTARARFAERANAAQERREQLAIKTRQSNKKLENISTTTKKIANSSLKKHSNNFRYWIFSASLKEIFTFLFLGRSRHF